jgi:hypothetical protein
MTLKNGSFLLKDINQLTKKTISLFVTFGEGSSFKTAKSGQTARLFVFF